MERAAPRNAERLERGASVRAGGLRGGQLALALSGGAARAMSHIGVLKALERHGISPTAIAGTSSGAVYAALYALSGSALEVERLVRSQDVGELWRQAFDFGLHRGALVNGRRLAEWMDRKFFFGATFADTVVPLRIACTDLSSRELVVLSSGSISAAVRASSALPGIFAPVTHAGLTLVDGGFLEPVPYGALPAEEQVSVLGVQAGIDVTRSRVVRLIRRFNASRPGRALTVRAERLGAGGVLSQSVKGLSLSLSSYSRVLNTPPDTTVLRVDPEIAWWDFHKSPRAIAAGEAAARSLLESLAVTSRA